MKEIIIELCELERARMDERTLIPQAEREAYLRGFELGAETLAHEIESGLHARW